MAAGEQAGSFSGTRPDERTTLGVVVCAGGYGRRLGASGPKQYLPLLGVPLVLRTLGSLESCPAVDLLVLVVNPEDVGFYTAEVVAEQFEKVKVVVGGGPERAFSVRNGLRALASGSDLTFFGVHDGARPLVTSEEVTRAVKRLAADSSLDGVVVGLPSTDTVKLAGEDGVVARTLQRQLVWLAQTPQIFRRDILLAAYDQPEEVLAAATDDSYLVEALDGRIAMVEGSPENIKVTTLTDLRVAEQILAQRRR